MPTKTKRARPVAQRRGPHGTRRVRAVDAGLVPARIHGVAVPCPLVVAHGSHQLRTRPTPVRRIRVGTRLPSASGVALQHTPPRPVLVSHVGPLRHIQAAGHACRFRSVRKGAARTQHAVGLARMVLCVTRLTGLAPGACTVGGIRTIETHRAWLATPNVVTLAASRQQSKVMTQTTRNTSTSS